MSDKELLNTINQILTILENNYRYNYGKKISYDEVFAMIKDLYVLYQNFEHNKKECGISVIKRYIPLLDLLIKIDKNDEHIVEYVKYLKYSYKIGARIS